MIFKGLDDDLSTWADFDVIKGEIANDRVSRTVDMYHSDICHSDIQDKEKVLREIYAYPSYDQTAFVTRPAAERPLKLRAFEEVGV